MRVKDVGVLAARNTFTLKVDKFLSASVSHDSLFSNVRLSSAQCKNPPQLHDIKQKKSNNKKQTGFLRKVFLQTGWTGSQT